MKRNRFEVSGLLSRNSGLLAEKKEVNFSKSNEVKQINGHIVSFALKVIGLFVLPIITFLSCAYDHPREVVIADESPEPIVVITPEKPKVDVVFCLDATGSMSGLIATAKEKIWSIAQEIVQSEPAPELRIGMVFYRDRGDNFVTRVYNLTSDLDSLYTELLKIQAEGGGDTPESVNQALHEAVNKMNWSNASNAFKCVFLVGDCPPHMDYEQDVHYDVTCALAKEKGIILNAIKLGQACSEAIPHFKNIAQCSQGEFLMIDQNASDVVYHTPFDDSINHYTYKIDRSMVYYGSESEKEYNKFRKEKAADLQLNASSSANSARTSYNLSKAGKKNFYGDKELIQDVAEAKISLKDIAEQDLPSEMQHKTESQKQEILDQMVQQRKVYLNRLETLNKKRMDYISAEKKKSGNKESFSAKILNVLKEQAKQQGVNWAG